MLDKERTTIQVYEETSGLRPGEIVEASGAPVSVTLAPGILDNIFDGIERPLERIADMGGAFITRGVSVDSLDREKKWKTHLTVKKGDVVHGGSVIAEVPETRAIVHKCMVPPEVEVAKVVDVVPDGDYTIDEVLVKIQRSQWGYSGTDYDTEMADPSSKTGASEISGKRTAGNRTAYSGYDVPNRKGRNGSNPRGIRNR